MTNGSNLKNQVTVSIVSHRHCSMLDNLLVQISNLDSPIGHIIITHNVATDLVIDVDRFPFQLTVIENISPLGFGANHNQAFQHCLTEYFCVLNPDVEFSEDPFDELLAHLEDKSVGIVAPVIVDTFGSIEDSYRRFPTPLLILRKALFGEKGFYKTTDTSHSIDPDWVAGMFMLLRSSTYYSLNGFDEKYFLYYEDIDLCLRNWRLNKSVIVSKNVSVIHSAQRDSHRNLKFLLLHLKSMSLFFLKHWLRFPR